MKLKRIIASALLLCMTLSMVACSSSTSTSTTTTTDTSTSTTTTETTETTEEVDTNPYGLKADGIYSASDEPIEMSVFVHYNDSYVIVDDMLVTNEIARYTNVTIKGAASEYADNSTTAFNLTMADTVLPDIVGGDILDITQYGLEGAFIPLNDLIDEYAPDIKAALELYPEAEAAVTAADGNIYAVPFIYENTVSTGFMIRQDWLDTLGLEIPTTVDEFEAVLTAFRYDDPNGNGLVDEVPYFLRSQGLDNRLDSLLALFGVSDYFHDDGTGTVAVGGYDEDLKYAITRISDWYANGLIDAEIWTRDNYVRDEMYPNDNGGISHDWFPSASAYNNSITDVEGFYLTYMLPPADINGDVWESACRLRVPGEGTGISADCADPVAAIKLLNFNFTDVGRIVHAFGVEGETFYYDDDGMPMYTDEILNGDSAVNQFMYNNGGMIQSYAWLHDNYYEYLIMHEEGANGTEAYADVVNKINVQLPSLAFTTEENDLITSKWPSIRAYMLEKLQVWTYDGSRIDAEFDTYMQTLRDMGIEDVLAAYQTAYDRFYA